MSKRAWYGKAYYFVELPRRFMVSLWGIPTFWQILPDDLTGRAMALLVAAGCLAYDLLVVSKAPDVTITREQIEAKLKQGGRLYYLTWRELAERLAVVALGFAGIAVIVWHWFSHGQEPTFLARVGVASIVLLVVGYVSALGVPLRTERDIPPGHKPVRINWFPGPSKTITLKFFGYPVFLWAGVFILSICLWGMGPSKVTGGLGYTGGFFLYTRALAFSYSLILFCVILIPIALFAAKIRFIHSSKEILND